jgi:hypothetical protein
LYIAFLKRFVESAGKNVTEKVQVLCFFCGGTSEVDIDKVDTRKRCNKCSD